MTDSEIKKEIEKLSQLKDEGIISKEEFLAAKSKLSEDDEVKVEKKVEVKKSEEQPPSVPKYWSLKLAFLWIFSVIGLIFTLSAILAGTFGIGFILLLSALIIFPPISKKFAIKSNKKYWLLLFISFVIFNYGIIQSFVDANTAPAVKSSKRIFPQEASFSTDKKQFLSYDCYKVEDIKFNGELLSESEVNSICTSRFPLKLEDGENKITIELISKDEEKSLTETLEIDFDYEAYAQRLADQEAAKLEAVEKAEAEAKAKEAAEAQALEDELNAYASEYCSNRKTHTRKYGEFVVSDSNVSINFDQGTMGKYLTQAKCRNIIDFVVEVMGRLEGTINENMLQTIIEGNYQMGMFKYYFFASAGNPDDINTSQYGNYKQDQVIYFKDSYGISAKYFYFDDGILTSYQDF